MTTGTSTSVGGRRPAPPRSAGRSRARWTAAPRGRRGPGRPARSRRRGRGGGRGAGASGGGGGAGKVAPGTAESRRFVSGRAALHRQAARARAGLAAPTASGPSTLGPRPRLPGSDSPPAPADARRPHAALRHARPPRAGRRLPQPVARLRRRRFRPPRRAVDGRVRPSPAARPGAHAARRPRRRGSGAARVRRRGDVARPLVRAPPGARPHAPDRPRLLRPREPGLVGRPEAAGGPPARPGGPPAGRPRPPLARPLRPPRRPVGPPAPRARPAAVRVPARRRRVAARPPRGRGPCPRVRLVAVGGGRGRARPGDAGQALFPGAAPTNRGRDAVVRLPPHVRRRHRRLLRRRHGVGAGLRRGRRAAGAGGPRRRPHRGVPPALVHGARPRGPGRGARRVRGHRRARDAGRPLGHVPRWPTTGARSRPARPCRRRRGAGSPSASGCSPSAGRSW